MEAAIRKNEEYYSCADYLEWDTEERYELIYGVFPDLRISLAKIFADAKFF